MKTYKEIEQLSLEWFEIKWGKIGGTGSSGLFVESDTLFIDLLSQVTEEFEPEDGFENEHTKRGQDLEPFAIEYLEKYTGLKFESFGWLQSERNELLGISPDGMTEDETEGAEVKCFARKKHMEIMLSNTIPKENICQAIHYFTVNPKLQKLNWLAFRPEAIRSVPIVLTRDSLVDIGWKKKGKVSEDRGKGLKEYVVTLPDLRTVQEWSDLALSNADKLLERIQNKKDELSF